MIFVNILMWLVILIHGGLSEGSSELKLVATVSVYIDAEGSYQYQVKGDPAHFEDRCHLFTFFALEAFLSCDPADIDRYTKTFRPVLPSEELNGKQKF